MDKLKTELERLINCASRENKSNTPDFILAEFMMECLESFERATKRRDAWWSNRSEIGVGGPNGGSGPNPNPNITAPEMDVLTHGEALKDADRKEGEAE